MRAFSFIAAVAAAPISNIYGFLSDQSNEFSFQENVLESRNSAEMSDGADANTEPSLLQLHRLRIPSVFRKKPAPVPAPEPTPEKIALVRPYREPTHAERLMRAYTKAMAAGQPEAGAEEAARMACIVPKVPPATVVQFEDSLSPCLPASIVPMLDESKASTSERQAKKELADLVERFRLSGGSDQQKQLSTQYAAIIDAATSSLYGFSGAREGEGLPLRLVRNVDTGEELDVDIKVQLKDLVSLGHENLIFRADVTGAAAARALKANSFGLSMPYLTPEEQLTRGRLSLAEENLQSIFASELGINGMLKRVKFGSEVLGEENAERVANTIELGTKFGWHLPKYTANVGEPADTSVLKGGNVFLNRIILYDEIEANTSSLVQAPLSLEARAYVCSRFISTVGSLHAVGLVHDSVDVSRFVIDRNGTIKLGGFGKAAAIDSTLFCKPRASLVFSDPQRAACTVRNELSKHTVKNDAWAVGMACYSMFTRGRMPFGLRNASSPLLRLMDLANTCSGSNPCSSVEDELTKPEDDLRRMGVSKLWANLVGALLDRDQERRPSLGHILALYSAGFPVEKAAASKQG